MENQANTSRNVDRCMYRGVYHLFTSTLSFHKSNHYKAPLCMYHQFVFSFNIPQIYSHVFFAKSLLFYICLAFDYPCKFFATTLPLHQLIIPTPLSPIISFYLKSVFFSTTHASVYHFYSASQNSECLFFFIHFLTLLFLKVLLFVPGKTKEKESYQPFLHCKCSVQSQRCYFHH